MRETITLPDRLAEGIERLARRQKKNRSALYRDAVAEYLARHQDEAVTDALNTVYADVASDPFAGAAAARVLTQVEW